MHRLSQSCFVLFTVHSKLLAVLDAKIVNVHFFWRGNTTDCENKNSHFSISKASTTFSNSIKIFEFLNRMNF